MDTTKSVTTTALARAIGLLTALKADYIIKLPDLEPIVHGDMQLMPTKPPKGKRSAPTAPHGAYTNYCREQGVDKMQVGDVLSFKPVGLEVQRVRSVACSLGGKHYGNDSVITTVRGDTVEIMRVQ
jgi:hypothetical protein